MPDQQKVIPINLRAMARSIARSYGDKGAIVVTYNEDVCRIGCEGLTLSEAIEALTAAIHYAYLASEDNQDG